MIRKEETTLVFIKYVGTQSGTAMAKAIKSYANELFDNAIIDECQHKEVYKTIEQRAEELANDNPKWKPIKITLDDNSHNGAYLVRTNIYWLRVDGETILTMVKASGMFKDC
ncbi:MAG: hypothetical protein IKS01_01330 [Paludibacteraceae bacterium]|nr:hypothetical protein [Paludibacteraceae bacterium]